MSDRLAVIVPTRGRPDNIRKVLAAWDFTGAWADADLVLATDADDPERMRYYEAIGLHPGGPASDEIQLLESPKWQPMVIKLDSVARGVASRRDSPYSAIAFAGDDHLPRTIGWARRYLDVLHELGSGMVYGDDGYQGAKLATEWAVTADCVRALGRMVPASVDHLYCDNAMMDLYGGAGAMRHLPEIRIEHMHPWAGKAKTDAQYDRVNHRDQNKADRRVYESWKNGLLSGQIPVIRALRGGRPDVGIDGLVPRVAREKRQRSGKMRGSGPRKIERSGPSRFSAPPKSQFPFPPEFRGVVGATPDEIAVTLADLAKGVPADQEIVELGVYQARTALIMAWGASLGNGAHVTAVDAWDLPGNTYHTPFTDPATREQAYANVQNLGYSKRVELINDFAVDYARVWNGDVQDKPIGLLFVDDDHSYEGAKAAIETWAPHLAENAVIAVDDYGHPDWPGVAQAVDELVDNSFLAPIHIFHERLAVTRLADVSRETSITAITADGVEPEPEAHVSRETSGGLRLEAQTLGTLRALGKQHGVSHAGVMGASKLIEALRGKGL